MPLSHLSSDDKHQPVSHLPGDTLKRSCADRMAARRKLNLCADSQVSHYYAALNMAPALHTANTDMLADLAPHHSGSEAQKFHYKTHPVSPCLCAKNHCFLKNLSDRCEL